MYCWSFKTALKSVTDFVQILTKDQVTARVDAVVYFRVADPIKAIILAENYFDSTFRISQSTLRDVLGTKSLSEILSDRENISEHLGVSKVACWGGGRRSRFQTKSHARFSRPVLSMCW